MLVEAAVLGGERRLDQVVREVFQRDRVVVLDAAAADPRCRSGRGTSPRGRTSSASRRPRSRGTPGCASASITIRPPRPSGGGFRQRLDEHPALPAADIEAVHEGRVALVQLAQCPRPTRTASESMRASRSSMEVPDLRLPVRVVRSGAPGPSVSLQRSHAPTGAPSRRLAGMLRQTQGAWFAIRRGLAHVLAEQGGINQWLAYHFDVRPNELPVLRRSREPHGVASQSLRRNLLEGPFPHATSGSDRDSHDRTVPNDLPTRRDSSGKPRRWKRCPAPNGKACATAARAAAWKSWKTRIPGKIYFTHVSCKLLDAGLCACKDYPNRSGQVPDCVRLTPDNVRTLNWLPPSCGYKLVAEGRDLY